MKIGDDNSMSNESTYVYHYKDEHVEVELTGRSASKTIPSAGSAPERKDTLVEITPVAIEDGRWKRFVREGELLAIESDDDV